MPVFSELFTCPVNYSPTKSTDWPRKPSIAQTILDEVLGFRSDHIEHQLAHAERDPNGRACNRTAHLPERRKMMQDWTDYLDKLKAGVEVIPINQRA